MKNHPVREVWSSVLFSERPTAVIGMDVAEKVSVRVYIDGRLDATYAPMTVEQAALVMADVIQGREPPRGLYRTVSEEDRA